MAESDWTELTNSEDPSLIKPFITTHLTPPNGGGSFVLGFTSLSVVTGSSGYFYNGANFAPTPNDKGGQITGAVARGVSAGLTGFSPVLVALLQGPDVSDLGYLLGLGNADPAKIVLKKGTPNELLSNVITGDGVLAVSTPTVGVGVFAHLRLDAVVNLTGEVRLFVFRNDLDANPVTAPVWEPVPGMDDIDPGSGLAFIDDAGGVNSGSLPYTEGRFGFAIHVQDTSRRAYFDHLTVARQT